MCKGRLRAWSAAEDSNGGFSMPSAVAALRLVSVPVLRIAGCALAGAQVLN
jgi:hypothetical protein